MDYQKMHLTKQANFAFHELMRPCYLKGKKTIPLCFCSLFWRQYNFENSLNYFHALTNYLNIKLIENITNLNSN